MKSFKLMIAFIAILPILIVIGCSDDDKTNNPVYTTPASLVGTWWYLSATLDGEPVLSFAEISHTDTSQTGSTTFNANATWSGAEYYEDVIVFTQSGTLIPKGDTLNITRTIYNGSPAPANDTFSYMWNVTGDTLSLTSTIYAPTDTAIVMALYVKQ